MTEDAYETTAIVKIAVTLNPGYDRNSLASYILGGGFKESGTKVTSDPISFTGTQERLAELKGHAAVASAEIVKVVAPDYKAPRGGAIDWSSPPYGEPRYGTLGL
jgi:hypothetical protein